MHSLLVGLKIENLFFKIYYFVYFVFFPFLWEKRNRQLLLTELGLLEMQPKPWQSTVNTHKYILPYQETFPLPGWTSMAGALSLSTFKRVHHVPSP